MTQSMCVSATFLPCYCSAGGSLWSLCVGQFGFNVCVCACVYVGRGSLNKTEGPTEGIGEVIEGIAAEVLTSHAH